MIVHLVGTKWCLTPRSASQNKKQQQKENKKLNIIYLSQFFRSHVSTSSSL